MHNHIDPAQLTRRAFLQRNSTGLGALALARHLNPLERAVLEKTLAQQRALFAAEKPAADLLLKVGDFKHPEAANPVELAAWTALANVLLNLNETISQ